MSNSKLISKYKLHKYKKEIAWLLQEKYELPDIFILSLFDTHYSKIKVLDLKDKINQNIKIESLEKDIHRIIFGEPVDYVIGFKEFLNCKIDLSLRPLIPRPETEFWVENQISNIRKLKIENLKILDLCCGSGCIGISLLKNISNCNVTFVDISKKSLEQTGVNLQKNNLDNKPINQYTLTANKKTCHPEFDSGSREQKNGAVEMLKQVQYEATLVQSNLFSNLKGQTFDYIFCNPPYVKNKDIKGSLNYEPKIALDGKRDGLEVIYKILSQFQNYLNPGGKLFLEFGYGQRAKISKFLQLKIKNNDIKIKNFKFEKDQFGKYRLLKIHF